MTAAQSDAELRDELAAYMVENDLGPHRGVQTLGALLAEQQRDGRMRADIDPEAAALLFVGTCLLRVTQRQFMGKAGAPPLPSLERTAETFARLVSSRNEHRGRRPRGDRRAAHAVPRLPRGRDGVVQPHALYRSTGGRVFLDGYQVAGESASGVLPGWREFDLAQTSDVEPLGEAFEIAPGFDPGAVKYRRGVLAMVTAGAPPQPLRDQRVAGGQRAPVAR